MLYNIRSLYNVGSIFRTSDAVGVKKIYLCGITPAPIDILGKPRPQLTKVSLGAEKYVSWEKVKSANHLISKLKREGYKIFAVEQNKKSIPYYKLPKFYLPRRRAGVLNSSAKSGSVSGGKFCLIMGNEVNGLPLSILKKSDKILEIPMKGKKESLNVSVAFGIVAYSLTVQQPKKAQTSAFF